MSDTKYQAEGLQIALEMELRGRGLYLRAREFTEDAAFLALLNTLADEELEHHAQFQALLDLLGGTEATADERALAAARAAEYFFPGGLMKVAMDGALHSLDAFLDAAIASERASVSFYGKLLSQTEDPARREALQRIIQEETTHLLALTDQQRKRKETTA